MPSWPTSPSSSCSPGDNVYGDVRNGRDVPDAELIQSLQQSYAPGGKVAGMARLRSTVPHLATWDDHDYGKNDAGADFAGRRRDPAALPAVLGRAADRPAAPARRHLPRQTFGPDGQRVQVILLDTRFFRSPLKPTDQRNAAGRERYLPDDDPGKTMLGEAQWAWLAERLREPADVRLIVSSIQVVAEGHGWERWGNFPARAAAPLRPHPCDCGRRRRLPVRRSAHRRPLPRDRGNALSPRRDHLERHQPGLSAANREAGPNRLGAVYGAPNFGTIDVDWWERTVTLSLRSENGEPVRRQVVRLDELTLTNP